jgi:aldose 1-epimerase
MHISNTFFGKLPDGREARLFQVVTENGLEISITNFGGIISSIKMSDRNGILKEICAGFENFDDYLKPHPQFGALVGRFAGRIAAGLFEIDGTVYQLNLNNPDYQLHGGETGFHTRLWDYQLEENEESASIKLSYKSHHSEEGFPGNLSANVTYIVHNDNRLEIVYSAETDQPTHVNLTNHAYYNLSGFEENLGSHQLMVKADKFIELNGLMLPTGKFIDCKQSPFYFRNPVLLSERSIPDLIEIDNCFVFRKDDTYSPLAILYHEESGRKIKVWSTQPAIQVYTGNFLDGSLSGHNGQKYHKHSAICLETQHFPDSPNHQNFPSTLLRPGEKYHHISTFQFCID